MTQPADDLWTIGDSFLQSTRPVGDGFSQSVAIMPRHPKYTLLTDIVVVSGVFLFLLVALCWLFSIPWVRLGLSVMIISVTVKIIWTPLSHIAARIVLRAQETAEVRQRPKRLILIRHAESLGNVDMETYSRMADHRVPLTSRGKSQALNAGVALRAMLGNESLMFYVSPYRRSIQTMEYLIQGGEFDQEHCFVQEDARLREQDWGNLQNVAEIEQCARDRKDFGSFYYRFPNGEAGSDVLIRVDSFLSSIFRHWRSGKSQENMIVVSHGITIRLFLMLFFKWTVAEFHLLWNLENCQMVILERTDTGSYRLNTPMRRNHIPEDRGTSPPRTRLFSHNK